MQSDNCSLLFRNFILWSGPNKNFGMEHRRLGRWVKQIFLCYRFHNQHNIAQLDALVISWSFLRLTVDRQIWPNVIDVILTFGQNSRCFDFWILRRRLFPSTPSVPAASVIRRCFSNLKYDQRWPIWSVPSVRILAPKTWEHFSCSLPFGWIDAFDWGNLLQKKTVKLAVSQSNIHKYVNPRVQESSAQLQLGSCHWDWAIVSLCAPSLLLVPPSPSLSLLLPKCNKRNSYIGQEHRSVGAHVEKTLVSVGWAVFLEA